MKIPLSCIVHVAAVWMVMTLRFPPPLRPPHLKDLEALEPDFYNSLLWIQENDPEPLDLTFTVEEVSLH